MAISSMDEVGDLLKNSDEVAAFAKKAPELVDLARSMSKLDDVLGSADEAAELFEQTPELADLLKNTDEAADLLGSADEIAKSTENYGPLMEKAKSVDVSTTAHQAVYYSGAGNRARAEAFALQNGKTTLEMTPGGKYFESLKLFDPGSPVTKDQAREIWEVLSERYAKGASGNVYGFVKGSNPGSIFNTVEYKALQKNPYITNIFTELFD